tara:strand:- start:6571 stop:7299 length:729 start_codon:yes stop_codon:yes gene_type:complete
MNKKRQPYYINYLIGLFLLSSLHCFSQMTYSEADLTGRGKLNLVGDTYKLQKEASESFINMRNEALKVGISIQIVSSYRSFNSQRRIWNRKYKKYISEGLSPQKSIEKVIEYSTIPGTSRHHWGTEIDIIDGAIENPKRILSEENYIKGGDYSNLKTWMDANSEKFGFYLVYNNNSNRKGFKYEPWHFTYKPLSKPILEIFLSFDLTKFLQKSNFGGSQLFSNKFLNKYYSEQILDINLELK